MSQGAGTSSNAQQISPGARSGGALDLPALQSASRVLQEQHSKDAQLFSDLGDMLTIPGVQSSASYSIFPDDYRVPYQKRRLLSIPDAIFQYYESASPISHMGIMPELDRVWITIDNKLFLWDYVEGQELSSFVDQPDVISHVALVKPKANVFIDEISHLLVICTPVSVLLLGVSVSAPPSGSRSLKEIKLYATDMSVPTEVELTAVIGSKDGRIFMCGVQDGNLYELHYQEKEGWFGKRVQLINHSVGGMHSLFPRLTAPKSEDHITSIVTDHSRDCFYTLSSKNTISVYRPSGVKAVQQLQVVSGLYRSAQEKAPASPALIPNTFQIIGLHVIEQSESPRSGIQLMAITANGVRLYFSTSSVSYGYSYGTTSYSSAPGFRPLQLVHVRLPPTNLLHPDEQQLAHETGYRPSQHLARTYTVDALQSSCYTGGLTVAAQRGENRGGDYLFCLAPDLTKIGSRGSTSQSQPHSQPQQMQPQPTSQALYGVPTSTDPSRPVLTEYATLLSIPGMTWAIAPVPQAPYHSSTPSTSPVPVAFNELAIQFCEPPKQFIVLTNAGITYLAKRRSLDYLKDVIEEFHAEGNPQPIIEFRDSFGRDQACAMLLAIASGNTFLDMADFSTPTFSTGKIGTVSSEVANVAKQAFYDFGERPVWTERPTYGTSTGENAGSARFSGRREGLAFYFARLIRPIWRVKLTQPGLVGLLECAIPEETLVTTQKNLHALKEFLDKNPHLFHSAPGDNPGARGAAANEQEAWKAEQNSVSQIQALLARTIEAISFLLLLIDYRLGELISQSDADTQRLMTSLTFEGLVTTEDGVTASRALVNIVIDQQIGQQISVDTISEVLQERCGSFCSTDDVLLYKAKENVRKAAESPNPVERQKWLNESLRLFTKGARIVDLEKLREICGDYQQLNYAKGAVELPLYGAVLADADRLGEEYWYAGCPENDRRVEFWERRKQCYDLVLDSLSVLEESVSTAAGQEPRNQEAVRNHAFELALSSSDEMFHSTLYDWLIERGLADELLEMRPHYLEAHLRREPVTVQKYQLLWQFYVKDGQPLRAAEVLAALADSAEFKVSLDARLEYLTLAVGNAKAYPVSAGRRQETAIAFLAELEDKLEVAQAQLEIYNNLLPHMNDADEVGERVRLLSERLFDVTELFQLYAEPFDLWEMQLLILHVANHRDDTIVRPIWNQIFEEAVNSVEPSIGADQAMSKVVSLGRRFYPSESAFPLRYIASLLVRFGLANKGVLPYGWAPRVLAQCGVAFGEIWDIFHEMYESQVPPFNDQSNVQAISSDIAVLLSDWMQEAQRPQSSAAREFPADRVDAAVSQYLAELDPNRAETKAAYENLRRWIRQVF
ncbi:nucleoporin [Heliocybe sulcata]|uniref:Nucleoporin n=1 Tax=Heliocybe sulcata TaxID=5364 RepID=A0A5C3NGK7_9AGAM|nr:nucleoporin [Heliocybe sulcata]